MFYGKPDINGRIIEFVSTDSYKVLHAGNFKFPKTELIREWLEPRIQAVVNSFQESEAFKSLRKELGEGSIIGGSVVAKLAGEGVSTNKLKNLNKFVAIEACYAIFKPLEGREIRILLNSEYLAGFCNDDLGLFELPELWFLKDVNSHEANNIVYQNLTNCAFCDAVLELQKVKGHGVVWYEDKMLNPQIVRVSEVH